MEDGYQDIQVHSLLNKLAIDVQRLKRGMEAFLDASFADCKNSLTTSGHVVTLYGDTIAWRTHNQTYVTLSTAKPNISL